MISRNPEAFFEIPKLDQVINCQKVAQIGSVGSYLWHIIGSLPPQISLILYSLVQKFIFLVLTHNPQTSVGNM